MDFCPVLVGALADRAPKVGGRSGRRRGRWRHMTRRGCIVQVLQVRRWTVRYLVRCLCACTEGRLEGGSTWSWKTSDCVSSIPSPTYIAVVARAVEGPTESGSGSKRGPAGRGWMAPVSERGESMVDEPGSQPAPSSSSSSSSSPSASTVQLLPATVATP